MAETFEAKDQSSDGNSAEENRSSNYYTAQVCVGTAILVFQTINGIWTHFAFMMHMTK